MSKNKHKNYEILNLIGYGLAKYDIDFINCLGFKTKNSFYSYLVKFDVAETIGTIKNRQDLFDPFFDNKRKGWWQKGDAYIHRKTHIDNVFGELDVESYSEIVNIYLNENFNIVFEKQFITKPIHKSKFKQLQITGREAELYFMKNYESISTFENGILEDARLYGDGYDFQIQVNNRFYLAEVKGIKEHCGTIRMTEKEYSKAIEFTKNYVLSVVSNLYEIPKITPIFDPIKSVKFHKQTMNQIQTFYRSDSIQW